MMEKKFSIAVDLDGTLAHYDGWKGVEHIGDPIQSMKEQVLNLYNMGHSITIFTARVGTDKEGMRSYEVIADWLKKHGFPPLAITNVKERKFTHILDDRAYHVIPNKGEMPVHPAFGQVISKSHFTRQEGGRHYKGFAIQPFEFVRKNSIPAAEAEVLTHVIRHQDKNGIEDLKKSIHLIQLIAEMDYGIVL